MVSADYFVEEVRRELVAQHGEPFLYQGGLSIRTTISPTLQAIADQALRDGLIDYDRRHGWRGPAAHTTLQEDQAWPAHLAEMDRSAGLASWQLALVMTVDAQGATIGLQDGSTAPLPLAELAWARQVDAEGNPGPPIERADQVVAPGDVIWVEQVAATAATESEPAREAHYALRQVPEIEGAIVVLNPHTGRVLAIRGGFNYNRSVFNRATQALRQPGSAFKPFVYLAALEDGFTPSSILLDAPIVIDQGPGLGKWKPANYSKRFYGPSTLRLGLEKSRNVMTVRLAQAIGMGRIREMAARFGLERGLGDNLASALGSNEVTLLQLTTAYAMLVNGGKRIEPAMIERIQDRHGRTVLRRDSRPCPECQNVAWTGQPAPLLPDQREQVVDPARSYQMVNMLRGVVERGTGNARAGDRQAGRRQDRHDGRHPGRLVRRLHAGPGGRRLRRLRPAQDLGLRRAGRERRAADLRAVHGGGAQGPAGDAVPRAARGPPGPGRCRYRAAGRPGHVDRDPRGVPARHRADRGQHRAGHRPGRQ